MSGSRTTQGIASTLVSSWSAAAKGKARASSTLGNTALLYSPSRCTFSTSAHASKPAAAVAQATSSSAVPSPPAATAPAVVADTPTALALLKTQPSHYIVTSLVGRTFVLHPRDVVTIPRLRDVQVGDVLELDRIHEVGSRDYTLRAQDPMSSTRSRGASAQLRRSVQDGQNESVIAQALREAASPESSTSDFPKTSSTSWAARLLPSGLAHVGAVLPASSVRARAVVIEHTKGAMERILKRKRRKGYRKTIEHKQPYTRLRLESIKIGDGSVA